MTIKHRVKFFESERGWGSDIWYRDFDTKELALAEVDDTNSKNTSQHAPDYYITAEYMGEVKDES